MSTKRYILLEVDEPKAEQLLEALRQRSYIKVLSMDTSGGRKGFASCPACDRKFSRESVATVTDEMLAGILRILQVMKVTKSAVLYHDKWPKESVRHVDHSRAVFFPHYLINKAEHLGLIKLFRDGSQDTYYVTKRGMAFVSGKEPLSPCRLTMAEGTVLGMGGSMMVEETKSKDRVTVHRLVGECRAAVKDIPESTKQFVETGQISLI